MAIKLNQAINSAFQLKQFPYQLLRHDNCLCEWLSNTQDNFTEPFFDSTITRLKSAAVNQRLFKMTAHVDVMADWAARNDYTHKPTALIFHVSRCGSTLFSQLLALQQEHMVLSEVPFFDELLRLPFRNTKVTPGEAGRLMHAALQFYIGSAHQLPTHVFIKTDSWHLHFYEQLRKLYPATPFFLLYREPWEVLQSQQRRRGMQSVPGIIEPELFNFTTQQATEYDMDKYMANVLHSYFEKLVAIASTDAASVLINYSEGVVAGMQKIATATGIPFSNQYKRSIEERAGFHAKYPGQVFKEENKNELAPAYVKQISALYHQLEELRSQSTLF